MMSFLHHRLIDVNRVVQLLIFFAFFAASRDSVRAEGFPYDAAGKHKVVTVASVSLKDATRGKAIEVLVRYPEDGGPFPVIVFSHGALSSKEAFGTASEHWASHGYVVIHPNHADAGGGEGRGVGGGRLRGLRQADDRGSEGLKAEGPDNRETNRVSGRLMGRLEGVVGGNARIDRVKDITSILDALDQLERQVPPVKGKLDRGAIAVAGHSFGAFVAQCHGGVRTLVDGKLTSLADSRVKCVVPISAQGESENFGLIAESWAEARTPALHITGTRDRSMPQRPGGEMGDVSTKVVPFERSPAGDKYLLIIEGATHVSFGGRLGMIRGGADAAGMTKTVSLAFLDAYLKRDAEAKSWLDGQSATTWLGARAKFRRKL
jgi:predicted dienelactone hydrolase